MHSNFKQKILSCANKFKFNFKLKQCAGKKQNKCYSNKNSYINFIYNYFEQQTNRQQWL